MTTELIKRPINAAQSKDTAPKDQALGFCTRKKSKSSSTWELWHKGETKQLDQFKALQMFGKPVLLDESLNPTMLRPCWQCNVKQDGKRRA